MNILLYSIFIPIIVSLFCFIFKKLAKWIAFLISFVVLILAGIIFFGGDTASVLLNLRAYVLSSGIFLAASFFTILIVLYSMKYMEVYNASEGFFALQNDPLQDDMLLMLDYGAFYEFIPLEDLESPAPRAYTIADVEKGINYALVITTNGGLWRYLIGDTVIFTSVFPHKIKISGRTKHFINAFGEEIIIDNAEKALKIACEKTNSTINDYTAAPVYMTEKSKGYHEWLIEFENEPENLEYFTRILDNALCNINSDYEAKRYKNITLEMPAVRQLEKGTFYKWLAGKGKLGGQNKVPRLSNNRKYVEEILKLIN